MAFGSTLPQAEAARAHRPMLHGRDRPRYSQTQFEGLIWQQPPAPLSTRAEPPQMLRGRLTGSVEGMIVALEETRQLRLEAEPVAGARAVAPADRAPSETHNFYCNRAVSAARVQGIDPALVAPAR